MRCLMPGFAVWVLVACGGGQPAASPDGPSEAAPENAQGAEPNGAPSSDSSEGAGAEGAGAEGAGAEGAGSTDTASVDDTGPAGNEFVLQKSDTAKGAQGATPSKIKPSKTEAAMKFIVVDKDKGAIPGVVISLTAPDGAKFYTGETDSTGYAEVLVPVGKKYSLVYLSLGRGDIAASVPVTDEPNQNIKLTLRYKNHDPEAAAARFVLDGVNFDTGKATIRPESFPRLDSVVEYLSHKKSARIEISGHTDNVGNPKSNKALSEKRAQACRDYLVSKGIDASRIQAVGYGDERPVAGNDTDAGRQQNRRIEATEL
jgi:outer membrane protein OmpA-like peptidoglycan-associated protein